VLLQLQPQPATASTTVPHWLTPVTLLLLLLLLLPLLLLLLLCCLLSCDQPVP
jgi:hypothetical protein